MTLILPPHNTSAEDIPAGVQVVRAGGPGGKPGKVWFEQRTFPSLVARCGANIAHVPYWASPLASPVPLVTSVLDVIPLMLPEYAAGPGARLYTSLVTATARGSGHIIAISEAAKGEIVQHLQVAPDLVTATHLGVDDAFHPRLGAERDAAVRARYNLPDDFVLYMGGFDTRKQVDMLLLAYTYVQQAENDRYPLILAGRAPAWGTSVFPDLPAYAEKLGLTDLVQWIGYVDEADKPSLYRLARVFVYPSMLEGFGLPVIEAMASGTPVVANDIAVFREIVGDGAYLVQNARHMAGAIIALLTEESLRGTLINQGLAQATHFSWRKTARKTLQVYEALVNQTRT